VLRHQIALSSLCSQIGALFYDAASVLAASAHSLLSRKFCRHFFFLQLHLHSISVYSCSNQDVVFLCHVTWVRQLPIFYLNFVFTFFPFTFDFRWRPNRRMPLVTSLCSCHTLTSALSLKLSKVLRYFEELEVVSSRYYFPSAFLNVYSSAR
jgi:hypothetical protein